MIIFPKRNNNPKNISPFDPTGKNGEWPKDDPMARVFENFKRAINETPELRGLHWECFKQAYREEVARRRKMDFSEMNDEVFKYIAREKYLEHLAAYARARAAVALKKDELINDAFDKMMAAEKELMAVQEEIKRRGLDEKEKDENELANATVEQIDENLRHAVKLQEAVDKKGDSA